MRLTINVSPTEWISRMLQGIEGLEIHPGLESDSLCVSVKTGRPTNFEVVSIPVLSQEKADELVRSWQDSAGSGGRQNKLIATRYLSSAWNLTICGALYGPHVFSNCRVCCGIYNPFVIDLVDISGGPVVVV